jgi:hypothetical protein
MESKITTQPLASRNSIANDAISIASDFSDADIFGGDGSESLPRTNTIDDACMGTLDQADLPTQDEMLSRRRRATDSNATPSVQVTLVDGE